MLHYHGDGQGRDQDAQLLIFTPTLLQETVSGFIFKHTSPSVMTDLSENKPDFHFV